MGPVFCGLCWMASSGGLGWYHKAETAARAMTQPPTLAGIMTHCCLAFLFVSEPGYRHASCQLLHPVASAENSVQDLSSM